MACQSGIPGFLILVALGLAAALAVVYQPALNGPFLLDDHVNVPQTRLADFSLDALKNVALSGESGPFGRPIPVATFSLNYWLTGDSTLGFKITNLVFHWINSILLFALTLQILLHLKGGTEWSRTSLQYVSLFVVLVWAFHPLQLSTVMYVVQRMTLLATMFTLAAMLTYTVIRARSTVKSSIWLWILALFVPLFGFMGILSKESAITLVFYLILLEVLVFKFEVAGLWMKRLFTVTFLSTLVLPLVLGLIYFFANQKNLLAGYQFREFSLTERLLTEPGIVVSYLKFFFLPVPAEMSLYHDGYPISRSMDILFVKSSLLLISMAIISIAVRKSMPLLSLGIGFFLCSHILESTVFPLELMFEHRNYLANWGLAMPLVWYSAKLLKGEYVRKAGMTLMVFFTMFLGWQTNLRAVEWSSSLSVHSAAVTNQPDSQRARQALAVTLAKQGDVEEAIEHYEYLQLNFGDNAFSGLALMQTRCIHGKFDEAQYQAVQRQLANSVIKINTVSVLADLITNYSTGQCTQPDPARLKKLYEVASANSRRRIPPAAEALFWGNFAGLEYFFGNTQKAIDHLKTALGFSPHDIQLLEKLASVQLDIYAWSEAEETINRLKYARKRLGGKPDGTPDLLEKRLLSGLQQAEERTVE